MASIGPFHTAVESSILLHRKNYRQPKFTFLANRTRRSIDFGDVSVCSFGGARAVGEDNGKFSLSGGCSRDRKWRIKRVKAKDEASGEAETGDGSEDALQATIEKSKKVLAMQKELLEQIAERRKLVSSIKSSMIETGDELSDKKNNGSTLSLNAASTLNGNSNGVYKRDTLSTGPIQSTEGRLEENPPSLAGNDLVEDASGSGKDLPQNGTPLSADSRKSSRTTTPKKFQPDELPHDLSTSSDLSKTSSTFNSNISLKSPASGTVTPGQKTDKEVQSEKLLEDMSKVKVPSGVPSYLSKSAGTSSVKDEKLEDIKESNQDEASVDAEDHADEDNKPPPLAGVNVMNVIVVAAECAPWSKTGGLGDVAGALPKALARRGHRVMVVAPLYGNYAEPLNTGVRKSYMVDGQNIEVNYFHAYIDGVDFVFIESHVFRHIERNIYGGNRVDVLKRMALFCKAAVEVPWYVPCGGVCYGDGNLVFIANDWHTAMLPVYLKAYYRDQGLMKYARSILVIHNIAYQGRGPLDDFSYVDLPDHYFDLFKLYDPVGGEHFNIFAAGLKMADRIVTVSHGYAWELKTSEGGWGLHEIISENDWKLRGIVNGIDTNEWSPELDVHLQSDGYTNYSLDTLKTGKPQCKAALQKELGLPVRDDVPLIGFIGRLDPQKGVDLIAEAVPWMMGQDVQLIMLGTGRPDLEQMLRDFENRHRDKARGWVGFSVKTAHRITAGADILLMPSRFEPCGLNQLYAMHYGTIPVVHAVGGLRDTVQPFDPYNNSGVGWTFSRAETNQLIHALGNCLLTYRQYKESWEGLQRRGMMQDLSWDNAAQNYEEVVVAAKYQW